MLFKSVVELIKDKSSSQEKELNQQTRWKDVKPSE